MRFLWISDFCLNLIVVKAFARFFVCFRILVIVGCTAVFLSGCSIFPTCTVICRDAMVKQGQEAYLNEDYTLARHIFSQLALRENHVQSQAAGLYGNACLDMILAEDAPAFRIAVEQFLALPSQLPCRASTRGNLKNSGQKNVCTPWSSMHPGMLEKALAHGMILLESERSGILEKLNELCAGEEIYKEERVNMHKKIDILGGKITALEKQNMEQEARIADLLHQIAVLEKIDKERQEQRENQ